jgi:hypothetical protein
MTMNELGSFVGRAIYYIERGVTRVLGRFLGIFLLQQYLELNETNDLGRTIF